MKFISPSQTIQIAIANIINSAFDISLDPSKILIDVCYPKYDAHYTSAISLSISNRLGIGALKIAEEIVKACSQNLEISLQWQIRALGKGWLNIFLSEQFISENLFALNDWQLDPIDILISPSINSPDPICQYAYARCCALIRLAHLLPDVDLEHSRTTKVLDFIEPAEISLLMKQFEIALFLENSKNLEKANLNRYKLSRSLAEIFLQFYDRCRIFGVSHEIAYRRLLLIRITQKLLTAIAPPEINYAMYL